VSKNIKTHNFKIKNITKIKNKKLTAEEEEIIDAMLSVQKDSRVAENISDLPRFASIGSMLSNMNGVRSDVQPSYNSSTTSSTVHSLSETHTQPANNNGYNNYQHSSVATTDYSTIGYILGGVAIAGGVAAAAGGGSGSTTTPSTTTPSTTTSSAAQNTNDTKTATPSSNSTIYQATTTASTANDIRIDGLLDGITYVTDANHSVELTYSFPWTTNSDATWSDNYGSGENTAKTHYGLNSTQINAAKLALQSWGNLSNVTFREVDEKSGEVGNIRFGFSSTVTDANSWGWSYTPSQTSEAGDVWIATNLDAYNSDFSITGVGYSALIHELGHTLGLKHPGNYESSDKAPFYDTEHDSKLYSVMSYNIPKNNMWFDTVANKWLYVMDQSPMIYDILAIQYLYGENNNYKTGNDTYSFDNSAPFRTTLWDAGGTDTISVENSNRGSIINLNEGSFSSIQTSRFHSAIEQTDGTYKEGISSTIDGTYNLGIAYGAIIENATGGSGNDIFIGNQYKNTLTGGAGSDSFVFQSTVHGSNHDTITDFSHYDDTIKLDNASFMKLAVGALSSDMFKSGVATDSNDYILYDKTTGYLSYDVDGNGSYGSIVFAQLSNKPTNLDYTDFVVI